MTVVDDRRSALPTWSPTVPVAGADHTEPNGQEDT